MQRQYSGANVVVGIAGRFDADAVVAAAEAAFAAMPAGRENVVEAPVYAGGVASRVQPGYSQTQRRARLPDPIAGATTTTPAPSPRRCSARA